MDSASYVPVADTYISRDWPDSNYGSIPYLAAINDAAGASQVSFVRFDLTDIPPGSTINRVEFTLKLAHPGQNPDAGIRLSSLQGPSWSEARLRWNDVAGNPDWGYSPIGTINNDDRALWTWSSATNDTLRTTVDQWVNHAEDTPNRGFVLHATSTWDGRMFYAREDSHATLRPLLNVDYTPPSTPGEIRGTKWDDLNGNGARDEGEPGLPAWRIYVDQDADGQWDAGERYDWTAEDGRFSIDDVPPGTHLVAEESQPEWRQTYPGPSAFEIEFEFVGFTATQEQMFRDAGARWSQVILGDLPDHVVDGVMIDDLMVEARVADIDDSQKNILGRAQVTAWRPDSGLPIRAWMEIDSDDLPGLEQDGDLAGLILHELGHALGIGQSSPWWDDVGNRGGLDPQFTGPRATAEYNTVFGRSAASVPLENRGGNGTRDSHWRECEFGIELMTGWYDGNVHNPLSRITAAALGDLGYQVDMEAADPYTATPDCDSGSLFEPSGLVWTTDSQPRPVATISLVGAAANGPGDSTGTPAGAHRVQVLPGGRVEGIDFGNYRNYAPVTGDDSYRLTESAPLAILAPGVFANDSDRNGDRFHASDIQGPRHGRLSLHPDGSFEYLPEPGYIGTDSFKYKVTDGNSESNASTVTIVIDSVETADLNEEFESDPTAGGWTSTDPSNVRWDSGGFLRARVNDETGVARWAYSPVFPVVEAGSFEFQFDIRPANTAWGTYPSIVLVQEGVTTNPYMDGALRVEAHWCDGYQNQFLINQSQDDPEGLFGLSPTFDTSRWYRHTLTYDAHDQTLVWHVTERDSGATFHTSTFSDVTMDPFKQAAIGHQGVPPVYGSWAEIYVDNVRLSSEFDQNQGIEFVTIGDPGNVADENGLGSVNCVYAIGKYEVTIGQYVDFLNAVAQEDPYGLWDSRMGSGAYGTVPGFITRSGASGSYTYSLIDENFRDRPVWWADFWDTIRFANWLHNGRPTTGTEDATTTEEGAYAIQGRTGGDASGVVRQPGARFFLPTVDEWYKAAYYKGGSLDAGYWDYPTQSDTPPARELPPGQTQPPGAANYSDEQQNVLDPAYLATTVGAYTHSPGPHGTFDQGGNVLEWVDYEGAAYRGAAGGLFGYPLSWLHADSVSGHADTPPNWYWTTGTGFRVAAAVVANNVPPQVEILGASGSVFAGIPISLTASVADPDPDDTHTFAWTVTREGQPYPVETPTDQPEFTFTPIERGTYEVTVTVRDDSGGLDADTVTVDVTDVVAVEIIVGDHRLLPDRANQEIEVLVTGVRNVTGLNIRAQLGDGSGPLLEPVFSGAEFGGGIWDAYPYTVMGGPVGAFEQFLQASVAFNETGRIVPANGLIVTLLVDTTGFFEGQFDLRLSNTEIGLDTAFVLAGGVELPVSIRNGSITIVAAEVAGSQVFYNNSYADGQEGAANVNDDGAIASDKHALQPGETATFANYTSYLRGINGIMVDIARLPVAVLDAASFEFRVGNTQDPSNWALGPLPEGISVRRGAGVGGSDRVTLIWPDGAIVGCWLQVTVLATTETGLDSPYVFYFGNSPGEIGNSATDALVDANDFVGVRDNPRDFLHRAPVDFRFDVNRDGLVDGTDLAIVRDHATNFVTALELLDLRGHAPASNNVSFGPIIAASDVLVPTPVTAQIETTQPSFAASLAPIDGGLLVTLGPSTPRDTNGDGSVNVDDVFAIIDFIESSQSQLVRADAMTEPSLKYDVSGDQLCTPLDVLLVINSINAATGQAAEGEGGVQARTSGDSPSRLDATLLTTEPAGGSLARISLQRPRVAYAAVPQISGYPGWRHHSFLSCHASRHAMCVRGIIGDNAIDLADALDADFDAALRDIAEDVADVWNAYR